MHLFKLLLLKHTATLSTLLFTLLFAHALFAAEGYATRYWDACKPHCSWAENADGNPVKSCNLTNQVNPITGEEIESGCEGGDAYTCWDMSPKRVSDTLSYGYAAVPATGDVCGVCYELSFTGTGKYSDSEPGSMALKAKQKKMIVMATNIGHDVSGGQFDILIPGGGVGLYSACEDQWGVPTADLGAQYGGFLTACQADLGYNDTNALKSCVQNSCDTVFSKPGMEDLKSGCDWYVDWFEMADNPKLEYEVVECPAALITGAYDVDGDSGSNTAPTITLATFSNGLLVADATDVQTSIDGLTFTWSIDNNEIATGSSVTAPVFITGVQMVTLTVSDGALSTQTTFTADFGSPIEVNTAPVISSASLSNGYFTATASDAQSASNALVFTWSIANNNVATGSTVLAPESITGTQQVTLTVSDGELSTQTTFTADFGSPVVTVNTAPVISSASLSNGYFTATASDAQTASNALVFTWSIANNNVASGSTVLAPESITGTQQVTLTVSDGELSTQTTFTADFGSPVVTVNTAPVIVSASLSNGYFIAIANDAQSANNTLLFTWAINNNIIAVGSTVKAPTSFTGINLVTLTVSDNELSTQLVFSADFGETTNTQNPTPENSNSTSNSTEGGFFAWYQLLALFAFLIVRKRRLF